MNITFNEYWFLSIYFENFYIQTFTIYFNLFWSYCLPVSILKTLSFETDRTFTDFFWFVWNQEPICVIWKTMANSMYAYCYDSLIEHWDFSLLEHYRVSFTAWKVSKYGIFSVPYFPVFGLNTEVNLRIQSKCRKIRTRKNYVFGHFSCSVCIF